VQLKVLRQLVEFQLCHSADIKKAIDTAWGVGKNTHRKKDPTATTATVDDGPRLEDLQLIPVGQDLKRRRYWVIDGMYIHTINLFTFAPSSLPVLSCISSTCVVRKILDESSFLLHRLSKNLLFNKSLENYCYIPGCLF
jgi:hypothetical protein